MFNPQLTEIQFISLLSALFAGLAGYALHARVLPWLKRKHWIRQRYFQPHPYLQTLQHQQRQQEAATPTDHTDKPSS